MRVLAFALATALSFLLAVTVLRTADGFVAAAEVAKTGTADVRECSEHGPIGRWGFGVAYTCRAEVRWDDGTVEQREFVAGQLRPGDKAVPVFLTKASRTSKAEAGRNDSARWIIVGTVGGYGLFALTLLLAFNTLFRLWFLVRPSSGRTTDKKPEEWPVTKAEIAAAPVPRRVWRLRLLAWLALAAGALDVLASIPRFDAPRQAGAFVSPWPHLGSAWVIDAPSGLIAGFGALVALVLWSMAASMRKNAARVVRYGQPYVDAKGANPRGGQSWIPTVILLTLAVWAVVKVVRAVPADAPALVWFASSRDALILLAVLIIIVRTRQSAKDMVTRLSQKSPEPQP